MFGEILKEIRNNHNDSLRKLGEKTGILFTYISKIENGTRSPSKDFVSKIVKIYPLDKRKLLQAYLTDLLPNDETMKLFKDDENSVKDIHDILFAKVSAEYKKLFLNMLIQRIEVESYEKGKLQEDKKEIEEIKKLIKEL